jgi:hypothetical protein
MVFSLVDEHSLILKSLKHVVEIITEIHSLVRLARDNWVDKGELLLNFSIIQNGDHFKVMIGFLENSHINFIIIE